MKLRDRIFRFGRTWTIGNARLHIGQHPWDALWGIELVWDYDPGIVPPGFRRYRRGMSLGYSLEDIEDHTIGWWWRPVQTFAVSSHGEFAAHWWTGRRHELVINLPRFWYWRH